MPTFMKILNAKWIDVQKNMLIKMKNFAVNNADAVNLPLL
jgi:hypothetical protein